MVLCSKLEHLHGAEVIVILELFKSGAGVDGSSSINEDIS
jgi:hypothetical protein